LLSKIGRKGSANRAKMQIYLRLSEVEGLKALKETQINDENIQKNDVRQ